MNAKTPEVSPVALSLAAGNLAVLRVFAAGPVTCSQSDLARAAGVSPKNIGRTLDNFEREGLIEAFFAHDEEPGGLGDRWEITDAGRHALLVAEFATAGRLPPGQVVAEASPDLAEVVLLTHDQLRPNPLQPRKHFDRQALDELKASIVAAGDVLQNLVVFPADADGVHTISAGERRWRAVGELIAEGAWEPGRRLRALVRENTAGQTAFIGLVENGQRANLTLLEEARAYAELIQETGWSARHAALQTGRDPRTVQEMLKVVREADPDDIAAHERGDMTWEKLRETVKEHRPAEAEPTQADVEDGAGRAPTIRERMSMLDASAGPIIGGGGGTTSEPPKPARGPSGSDVELTRVQTLALVELAHKLQTPNIGAWAPVRRYWLHAESSDLAAHQFVVFNHAAGPGGPHAGIPDAGYRWLAAHGYERDSITPEQLDTARIAVGQAFWPGPGYVTPWLNVDSVGLAATLEGPTPWATTPAAPRRAAEEFDHAEATLGQVVRALDGGDGIADPVRLLKAAGVTFPLRIDAGLAIYSNDGEPILDLIGGGDIADDLLKARGLLLLNVLNAFAEWTRREPADQPTEKTSAEPYVPIRRSITPEHIVCLEDGRKLTSIAAHLRASYGLTPQGYRTKWGLPADYPMTAPNESKRLWDVMRAELGIDTDSLTQIEDGEG